jgi:hypothetical protein
MAFAIEVADDNRSRRSPTGAIRICSPVRVKYGDLEALIKMIGPAARDSLQDRRRACCGD